MPPASDPPLQPALLPPLLPPLHPPLLSVRELGVRFGGLQALANLSFAVAPAELIGIIGPNGAGKTTLFHALSGIVTPTHGALLVDGVELTGRAPQVFCRHARRPGGLQAGALLERVELAAFADAPAGDLPPARQRRLEIAMALATSPRLLLLDEVAAGLTEKEADRTAAIVSQLRVELGIAVVWIEHTVGKLMRTVDRMLVLNHGELIADGAPAAVAADKRVIDAYLGVDEDDGDEDRA